MNKIKTLSLFCFICFGLMLTSCGKDESKEEIGVLKGFSAQTETVEKTSVPLFKTFPGRVRAKVQIVLASKMPGYVKEVPVQIGQEVKKGSLLVAIDDTDIKARIESLLAQRKAASSELSAIEAKYEYAKINYDRFKRLYNEESATKDELDRARTNFKALKNQVNAINSKIKSINAQLKEAKNQLSYLKIKAPMNGWISGRMVDPGTFVNPGQPLIKLDGKDVGYWFDADIDNALIDKVKIGEEVTIAIPALNLILSARLEHIQRSSNLSTNTFNLLADLGQIKVKSGLFGRIFIPVGKSKEIILPQNVIVKRAGIDGVYVVDEENVVHWRIVRLGKIWQKVNGSFLPFIQNVGQQINKTDNNVFVTVLSGLMPGERIVVSNLAQAKEGGRLE